MGEVSKGEGRTVLFVSHNMDSINRLCKNALLLSKGENVGIGKTSDIIKKYNDSDAIRNECYFKNQYIKYLKIDQIEDNVILECKYENCAEFFFPCLGFVVNDANNHKIFGTNPKLQPPQQAIIKSDKGILRVLITNPKLLNGTYNISIWFGDGTTDYFFEENILSFEILNMVRYAEDTSASDNGPIAPEVKWHQILH